MKTKVYGSAKSSFALCIDELYEQFSKDFDEVDFLFFAIHPDFGVENINETIQKTFNTDKFLAFHAVDAFENENIVGKMSLCSVKFEREGEIKTFYLEDIDEDNSIEKSAEYFNSHIDSFHIFIAGLCGGKISSFAEKLSTKLKYEKVPNIVGGVSSGNLEADELMTYQFIDNRVIRNGFVVVSFSNVEYETGVSFGFQPYGISYEITKSKGNKLYSVDDGKSASYMATKMLENIGAPDMRYLWYVPFAIYNKERGYVNSLRTIANVTDEYVEFFAPIHNGDFFKLSFATDEDLLKEDAKIARDIIHQMPEPEMAFNFSCIARQYVLEDNQGKEAKTYRDIFATSLFGFFTFGEIGFDKAHKRLKFYNETSLITIMREK